ncbi:MAG: sugar ABC transporter ATP-binding protein [Treponema sp.]
MENAIQFNTISKLFPGVKALDNVSFSVRKGEVHALLGENGAGKSTLLNILHGIFPPTSGSIDLFNTPVSFSSPKQAILAGISKVHQEINSAKDLTVGQNVTLGYEKVSYGIFVDYKTVNTEVNQILKKLNCDFRSEDLTSSLSAGQLQMIEIAKALFHHSKVISFDEPTAALTDSDTQTLFSIIRELKSKGYTIIYVSHRLEEIFQICDRATILRDGQYIKTLNVKDTDRSELVTLMAGRSIIENTHKKAGRPQNAERILEVTEFSGRKFKNSNFFLNRGEILGFFGLVGAGRTELMRALVGADEKTSGSVFMYGKKVSIKNTEDALKLGIGLLPEERKTQGFMPLMNNLDNVAVSSLSKYEKNGFIVPNLKYNNYTDKSAELNIKPADPYFMTRNLSGGNQQKVVLGRWLSTDVNILIFDEPTKGIDVSTKVEIYKLMDKTIRQGKSIIMISSELKEVLSVSDRIVVMYEGNIIKILDNDGTLKEEQILSYALGEKDNEEKTI